MSTTTVTRAAAGHAAAGGHHGYPLAQHRDTGQLVAWIGDGWWAVARVVAASPDQIAVACPYCLPDRRGKPTLHHHGRAGGNGEGHRAGHCRPWRGDYVVLDIDDVTATVPLSPAQQHHSQNPATVTPIAATPAGTSPATNKKEF